MTTKSAIILVYIAFLAVFFIVIMFATFLDIIGICTYKNGVMETCQVGNTDVAALYNTNPIISIFASSSLFIFWILLGGCTLYIRDWLKKRNA